MPPLPAIARCERARRGLSVPRLQSGRIFQYGQWKPKPKGLCNDRHVVPPSFDVPVAQGCLAGPDADKGMHSKTGDVSGWARGLSGVGPGVGIVLRTTITPLFEVTRGLVALVHDT